MKIKLNTISEAINDFKKDDHWIVIIKNEATD